ncbi:MAG: STAS domain-containing protein [Candidatus Sedimenticola sp. (ex Thyasira tokunagai)]
MDLDITHDAGVTRIRILDEMTIYTVSSLWESLLPALDMGQPLELDLSQVFQMDCAGLQLLLLVVKESKMRDLALTTAQPGPALPELLALIDLSTGLRRSLGLPPAG